MVFMVVRSRRLGQILRRALKWRFDLGQSATRRDLRLVLLAAEAIDTGLDPYFLTVEIIGAGRQPQAASNLVDVIKDLVDQGAEPRTLLSLLRCLLLHCLLVRCLLVDHRAPPTTTSRRH